MKKSHLMIFALLFLLFGTWSQNSSAQVVVPSADDYATLAFQDPWDMNERTDVGWFTFNVIDQPHSNLTNITFFDGIFSAWSTNDDPNITLLDTYIPLTCPIGKIGKNFPIDADKYQILMFRMKLQTADAFQLIWSKNTIYPEYGGGISTASYSDFTSFAGWRIYSLDIPTLTLSGSPWSGTVDYLRLDPTWLEPPFPPYSASENIQVDWVRLVENNDTLYKRTITWSSPSGPVDIYLNNNNTDTNPDHSLGKITGPPVSTGSYGFYFGGLPYGTYHVLVCNAGTSSCNYLSQNYVVNDIPTLKFTSPSEEGSSDDFATAQLGDPWDMNAVTDLASLINPYSPISGDIDYCQGISSLVIDNISAEDEGGRDLGSITVLKGMSEQATINPLTGQCIGDPYVYPLFWTKRGTSTHIDSNHYRILVLEMGLPGNRDYVGGSIARVVWGVAGEQGEYVSQDIVLNHKSNSNGAVVIDKIITDMRTLPIAEETNTPLLHTGWNGMMNRFRIDPHEFCQPKEFYIKNIKLVAFEKANNSYIIRWQFNDQSSTPKTMSLFYDTDNQGYNGTLIVSGIDPTAGVYTWDTSLIPDGTYYIYATYANTLNSNQTYARWPVVIDHSSSPTPHIWVSSTSHNFDKISLGKPSDWTLTVRNDGSVDLVLGQITTPSSPFSIFQDNCSGHTLALGATCTVIYRFRPDQEIASSDSSNIPSNDPVQNLITISLTGTGTSETVSTPTAPSGTSQGSVNILYAYSTGSIFSSLGHTVEYQFDWKGDGSDLSGWGSNNQSKNWTISSTYFVRVRARCTSDPSVVSLWSSALTVRILTSPPPVDNPPFGSFDIPAPNSTLSGVVQVGGWALDDVLVTKVELRSDISFWPYIGDLYYTCGTRPDVKALYSNYPNNDCAGWGYMWLTNSMSETIDPQTGQRLEGSTHRFYLRVYDTAGHYVDIGSRNITIRNDPSSTPFGAMDIPGAGEIVNGRITVAGWALAKGGRRVNQALVRLDGVVVGQATYGLNWPPLAQVFPVSVYPYSENAAYAYGLDTTLYSNGQHALDIVAADEVGNLAGIGSRYIYIQN